MTGQLDVRISAIEHHEYCARRAALVHAEQFWADNRHTVRGTRGHRRVDSGATRYERGRLIARSLEVWSDRHGMIGRCDVVEVDGGTIAPVEYKMGRRHGRAADLQVCAQGMCLEEMLGIEVPAGFVYYRATRRRQRVVFSSDLRRLVVATVTAIRGSVTSGVLPMAPDDERCTECQLIGQCLPSLVASPGRADSYVQHEVFACD